MTSQLKRHISNYVKCVLVGLCAFAIGGLITIPFYALLHVAGWLGRNGSPWGNENKEFIFKMIYLLSTTLGVYLVFYLQKLLCKSS